MTTNSWLLKIWLRRHSIRHFTTLSRMPADRRVAHSDGTANLHQQWNLLLDNHRPDLMVLVQSRNDSCGFPKREQVISGAFVRVEATIMRLLREELGCGRRVTPLA
jgi:hypothetical protein